MGRRTIGRRWPSSASSEDYVARCDYCGVPWMRSQLRIDTRGLTVCREHGDGADVAELSMLNAEAAEAWAQELATRPPRDRGGEYGPEEHYPAAGFPDSADPGLPVFTFPTRALTNHWAATSGRVLSGNDLTSWTDAVGGKVFTPTTGAFEYTASHSLFRGKPAIVNDTVSANSRMTAGVAADWTFMHNGSGMTVAWVASASGAVHLNTSGGVNPVLGFNLRTIGSASVTFRVGTGTDMAVSLQFGVGKQTRTALWVGTHKSSSSPAARMLRGSTELASGQELASPSASAPAQALEMRADVTSLVAFTDIFIYNDELTQLELEQLQAWANQEYGTL